MNQGGLFHVGSCCISGLNTSDQMRISRITRLAQVHFVSIPGEAPFSPNMSLWIVRRAQRQVSGGKHIFVSQVQMPVFPKIVLNPNLSQDLHLGQMSEQSRSLLLREHRKELSRLAQPVPKRLLVLLS